MLIFTKCNPKKMELLIKNKKGASVVDNIIIVVILLEDFCYLEYQNLMRWAAISCISRGMLSYLQKR